MVSMRTVKIFWIFCLLVASLVVNSCTSHVSQDVQETVGVRIPVLKANEIYVFKNNDLIAYDVITKRETSFLDRNNQYFYYFFDGDSDFYTAGDSDELGFVVYSITKKEITEIKKMHDNEYIFPLARDANSFLYFFAQGTTSDVMNYREKGIMDENVIVVYDGFTWRELKNTRVDRHNILTGKLIGKQLYYSVANPLDADSQIDLYCVDISNDMAQPQLVRENLLSDLLLSYKGQLLLEEKEGNIRYGDHVFPCLTSDFCWVVESKGLFLSVMQDGTLKVFDIETGDVVDNVPSFLSFRVKDEKLIVYCDGEMKEY
ncbi:MAG: hypothetical protein J6M18_00380 [Actinomycetaceae bacterium]|nr:hypothetical protein [Actinomycetaceae bacterium]